MSAPAKVITNGTGPVLNDWRFRRSSSGPDEISFTAQNCSAVDTYKPGDMVPGYSNMRIVETDPRLVPGTQFDIACRARGLITGYSKIISRRVSADTLGWDTLTERRIELEQQAVPQFGQSHPSVAGMYFMSYTEDESFDRGDGESQWVTRDRTYKGLISGSYKLVSRRITTNESISSSDDIIVNLPGGWATGHPANVSLPRVVVEDTVITNSPPPTSSIPGNYVPPSPPQVTVYPVSDSIAIYNWPSGWKLNAINSQELFHGAGMFLQTLTYEYVWLRTF